MAEASSLLLLFMYPGGEAQGWAHFIPHIAVFLLAVVIALFTTPLVIRFSERVGLMDKPNERKVHVNPTPLCGGIALYIAFIASTGLILLLMNPWPVEGKMLTHYRGLLVGATMMLILGLIDDRFAIKPKVKLAGQILTALVIIGFFDINIPYFQAKEGVFYLYPWQIYLLSMLWIIGITNAVNLLDGLDGLLTGVAAISGLFFAIIAGMKGQYMVSFLMAGLVGSCLGFLRYNFNPAKIFMGDTGSLFLGMTFACLSTTGFIKSAATVALFIPVFIMALPILDTGWAIIRRMHKGKPIFQADKEHLHHRLLGFGMSQKQVVLLIYLINMMFGSLALSLIFIFKYQGIKTGF